MVTVIILSYNTREITLRCLENLYKSRGVEMETIVVDNASGDGSADEIGKRYKDIKIIRNKKNEGFARGNNQGMKRAKGDKILLLNSDCFVNEETLKKVSESDFDVVGCKLLNSDGTIQPSWGYFPTLRRIGQMMVFIDNLPVVRRFIDSIHVRDLSRYEKEQEVDWVTGACVMLKREVFAKVGGIDEKYFMYGEEMEWMYRIKQAGYKIGYTPQAVATHLLGASSKDRGPAVAGEMKGWLYWFAKHNPVWQRKLLPYVISLGCLLRIFLIPARSKYYRQAIFEVFGQSRK